MILDNIVEASKERIAIRKEHKSLEELLGMIYHNGTVQSFHGRLAFSFERAISKKGMSYICEIKKASPSKGVLVEEFNPIDIALAYHRAGADAISILTEPDYFQGNIEYMAEISNISKLPLLQKDFIIDEYQIYEAKVYGADAILLIAGVLDTKTLERFIKICNELGLSALVETHNEEEIKSAIKGGARVIGVNNRDLRTFEVDLGLSMELRPLVPSYISFVAESGIRNRSDIEMLEEGGVNGVLVGETLMTSMDKKKMLDELRGI